MTINIKGHLPNIVKHSLWTSFAIGMGRLFDLSGSYDVYPSGRKDPYKGYRIYSSKWSPVGAYSVLLTSCGEEDDIDECALDIDVESISADFMNAIYANEKRRKKQRGSNSLK